MSWHPNSTGVASNAPDDEPTLSQQTRIHHRVPDDDDPTIARPGLRGWADANADGDPGGSDEGDEADEDPTLTRKAVAHEPDLALLDHRYQLLRQIGRGGMGEVWQGRHVALDRPVAIKFLTQDEGGPRFKREAQAIVSIRHSGVVNVLDFGETEQGVPYFAMELIEGETLALRVHRQGPLSWAFVRNIALEVSDALAHAHAAGVVHRDLKPSNVIVLDSPPPRGGSSTKLIDFGIAKLLDTDKPRLTKTGYIQGTPAYMSPEQVLGEPVDGRADVYGLGCLLYFLLSGRKPFAGKKGTAALRAQIYDLPPRFAEIVPDVSIPPEVEAVVFRAIAKDREARFPSMIEMQAAILAIPPDASASLASARVPPPFALRPHEHEPDSTLSESAEFSQIGVFGAAASTSSSMTGPASSHTTTSAAALRTSDRRSLGETIGIIAAVVGSIALLGAAIVGLIWALTT